MAMSRGFSESVRASIAGGAWIYLSGLTISLTGFAFWIALTRIVGVSSVGLASTVVSSASIAATLVSAGLNLAIAREVATRGWRAVFSAAVLSVVLSVAAALVAVPMIENLGIGDPAIVAVTSLLAFLTVLSLFALSSLIGFERFRHYFVSALGGSIAKLLVGTLLALMGMTLLAPLVGYLAYPATALVIALAFLLKGIRVVRIGGRDVVSLASLAFSNYPFVFSNQLMTMLSVYLFAYVVKKSVPTGVFYISMMVALAVASIPSSILGAALPIGARRGTDPFAESLRIGLSVALPIAVPLIAWPQPILATINPRLLEGVNTLRILLLSIVPLSALSALINKLNREGRAKEIALVGISRLALLASSLLIFSKTWGLEGAALAFFVASAAFIPYVFVRMPSTASPLTKIWAAMAATGVATLLAPSHGLAIAVVATVISILMMHFGKVFTLSEALTTARIVLGELRGGGR